MIGFHPERPVFFSGYSDQRTTTEIPILMQEPLSHGTSPTATKRAPLHDEIAQCARDLWFHEGQPIDRDVGIWLDAEQRLLAATPAVRGENLVAVPLPSAPVPPALTPRTSDRPAAAARGRAAFATTAAKAPVHKANVPRAIS
jgi:hypothetical protein